jgi:predicted nucleotidyltransferase
LSSAEVRYHRINFNEILGKLRTYAEAKAKAHDVKAIVLAGSLAKGTYTGLSDADILVIAEAIPKRALERYGIFADPNLPIDVQPRVYTPSEFIRIIKQQDRFAQECLEIGIPLYGEGFFKGLRDSLSKPQP